MCQWARVEAHLNSIGEELLALYGPTPEGNPLFPLRLNNRWGEDAPARWHEPKLEADPGRPARSSRRPANSTAGRFHMCVRGTSVEGNDEYSIRRQ